MLDAMRHRRRSWLVLAALGSALISDCTASEGSWADILDHGSVLGFPSYSEANQLLEGWLDTYPDILSKRRIGSSFESRPIFAYVLGSHIESTALARPQVLLTSLTHAREPAGLTVLLYFLGRMLELYAQHDAEAVYVLRSRQIFLVPFVNPDGYVANEARAEKMVRKNRRPTCGDDDANGGVDLNRNFGVHWSADFSVCNEEYQGDHPFSEPETQALRWLVEGNEFKAAVNFHTYGGMLTHPYNWAAIEKLSLADQQIYTEIGDVFQWPQFGPAIQTVGYTTSGEMDDWMYGARGIISMSPEVGPESGGFWPPRDEIMGINRRNFVRMLYVVHKAGAEVEARLVRSSSMGRPVLSHGSLAALPGSASQEALDLDVRNGGLSSTAGAVLGVAIAGAAAASASGVDGAATGVVAAVVNQTGSHVAWARWHRASGSATLALAFALPAMARRSRETLRVLVGRSFLPVGALDLRFCIAEDSGSAVGEIDNMRPRVACQCFGDRPLEGEQLQNASWFRAAGDADGFSALCAAALEVAAAAAAAMPAPAPALRTEVPSAAAEGVVGAADARHAAARDSAAMRAGDGKAFGAGAPVVLAIACAALGLGVFAKVRYAQSVVQIAGVRQTEVASMLRTSDNV